MSSNVLGTRKCCICYFSSFVQQTWGYVSTVSRPFCSDSAQFSNVGKLNFNLLSQPALIMKAVPHSRFFCLYQITSICKENSLQKGSMPARCVAMCLGRRIESLTLNTEWYLRIGGTGTEDTPRGRLADSAFSDQFTGSRADSKPWPAAARVELCLGGG